MKEYIAVEYETMLIDGKEVGRKGLYKFRELVRCRDCKHYLLPDGYSQGECMARAGWFPVAHNWFCADGKRKEADNDS